MSIRLRLSLLYAGLLGAILVAFGLTLYLTMTKALLDEVDSRLTLTASQVHMAIGAADDRHDLPTLAEIAMGAPMSGEFDAPGLSVQVLNVQGQLVSVSPNLRNEQLPIDPMLISDGLNGSQTLTTLTTSARERVRVLTMPLTVNAKVLGVVQVGQSLHDTDSAIERLRLLLGFGSLGTVLTAGVGSWFIAKRGLKPIDEIAETARQIGETRDFGRRIDAKVSNDEVGMLANTFNDMISEIEGAFETQRQFIADSSHELRTPLTVIRGNVDVYKRSLSDKDRQECIAAIESEAERMSLIVSELLLLAQLDAGQEVSHRPVELDSLLLDVYKQAKVISGGRKVILAHEDAAVVSGDADRLKQVLYNLVDNAIKYSPEGATITLSLHKELEWVRVDVTDTGAGIAPEDLPRVFDRFYRADRSRSRSTGGTGLGLAVVKQIAEAHGGYVTVTSEPGQGSTFSVWLPLA